MLEKKDQRFEMLMTKDERKALASLAAHKGVSQADMVRQMIEQTDQRVMEATHEENTDLADSELVEPTSSPEE